MSNIKRFVDLDLELDIPLPPAGDVSTKWITRMDKAGYDKKHEFKDYLMRNDGIFEIQRDIIEEMYLSVQKKAFDTNKPNLKDSLLYHEGFKEALRLMHKLLPRQ